MKLLVVAVASVLASCGHLAPYSDTPLESAELYEGGSYPNELRIRSRVQVYDIIPRSYVKSHWIQLTGTGDELVAEGRPTSCIEGTEQIYGRTEIRGKVSIAQGKTRLALEERTYGNDNAAWHPWAFNGEYRLVRANASAVQSTLVNDSYRCRPPQP